MEFLPRKDEDRMLEIKEQISLLEKVVYSCSGEHLIIIFLTITVK
jgi:hypothetical protein